MGRPIEGLSSEQEAHAKRCPKCQPGYERAMKSPRDWNALASCKQAITNCMNDARPTGERSA